MNLEFPGLTAKLKDKMDWLRGTMDAKHVTVKLTEMELTYIQSCMAFYVYEASMRRAEKLPLAVAPNVHGWTIMDHPPGHKWVDAETAMRHNDPDTLPCETEAV